MSMDKNAAAPIIIKGEILSEHTDLAQWMESDPARVVDLPGSFWVARRTGDEVTLVCSRTGQEKGFYYANEKGFHFGSNLLEILRSVELDWEWNFRALAGMVYLGHILHHDSYHAKIRRLWAGEIVRWKAGKVEATTVPEPPDQKFTSPKDAAIDALVDFVHRYAGDDPVVPISGGYDSRVILAAFLGAGVRPTLFVHGANRNATDVRIAHQIAAGMDLPIRYGELRWEDYAKYRDTIVELTSGTKTADNWHTFMGAKQAGFSPNASIFPGTNGEYVRTLWADRGLMLVAADLFSRFTVPMFWDIKLNHMAVMPSIEQGMSKEFANYLSGARDIVRKWVLEHYGSPMTVGQVNDEFLRTQRVPTFHADGFVLYEANCHVRNLFLDPTWCSAVRQMPRYMKLGCRWNRYAINRLCPKLLEFPNDETGVPMGKNVRPSYWLGRSYLGAKPRIPYVPDFLGSDEFLEMLAAALPHISDLFDPGPTMDFLRQGRDSKIGQRSISIISALAFWMEAVHKNTRSASASGNR